MVAAEGLTRPELAERYGVTERVVSHWTREPDWPAPVGKLGNWTVYDPAKTDAVVAAWRTREVPDEAKAAGSRLLTAAEIADMFGLKPVTVRGYVHRGMFGDPDEERQGVKLWRADRVAKVMEGRRKYKRA